MSFEELPPLTNHQIRIAITKVAINSAQSIDTIKRIISESGVDISDENINILKTSHDRLIKLCREMLGLTDDE
ncbi:hypothetical protein [Novacetimonas hansenii]|uniref:hypothetical protein n=1 Tax=Novacetimonas hansenii TaxID=436 RepID=UPI0011152D7B|nr:hypothetical protein [Novacetimonas hansenii]